MEKIWRGYRITVERQIRSLDGLMDVEVKRLSDGFTPIQVSVGRNGTVHDAVIACVDRINVELNRRDPWDHQLLKRRNSV